MASYVAFFLRKLFFFATYFVANVIQLSTPHTGEENVQWITSWVLAANARERGRSFIDGIIKIKSPSCRKFNCFSVQRRKKHFTAIKIKRWKENPVDCQLFKPKLFVSLCKLSLATNQKLLSTRNFFRTKNHTNEEAKRKNWKFYDATCKLNLLGKVFERKLHFKTR
jgi:hypothetical protein